MNKPFEMNLQLFAASQVESLTNPRDSLPNVFTNVTAREVDFVTRFGDNWDALRNILGIMRPIRKAPGTTLISYTASIALEDGDVGPGEVIPYSKSTIVQASKSDLTIEKYAKAVPIEDVNTYGAEIAVEKSDDAFLTKLQNVVLGKFYTFLNTGSLTGTATTWKAALAKAQGEVLNKFASMQKDVTEVVGFANILDAYDYLGSADITVQTQFGLNYVKDFMGYSTLFLLPAAQIARGKVIAVPVENIDLYYVDPADSEFAKLGLNYTVQGETNLIGFHAQGNYSTAVGESYALMGMTLWAEYLDGIAVITVNANPFDRPTVSAPIQSQDYWGHTVSEFQADDVAVSGDNITGTLYDFEGWASGPLEGPGHFLAVKFSNIDTDATGVKVGLVPSAGTGLVELDSDKDAVLKIADKDRQQLHVELFDAAGNFTIYNYNLSGLKYEAPGA